MRPAHLPQPQLGLPSGHRRGAPAGRGRAVQADRALWLIRCDDRVRPLPQGAQRHINTSLSGWGPRFQRQRCDRHDGGQGPRLEVGERGWWRWEAWQDLVRQQELPDCHGALAGDGRRGEPLPPRQEGAVRPLPHEGLHRPQPLQDHGGLQGPRDARGAELTDDVRRQGADIDHPRLG